MTSEELLAVLAAVGHAQRLRVIAELSEGRLYVSELARRLGISRPLLYMHLERLEKAGLIIGTLELSEDGKALKFFELADFDLHLTADTILAAVRAGDSATGGTATGDGSPAADQAKDTVKEEAKRGKRT
ncbi:MULTISPECIES: winged helix-turn-helix domain-containing protein [Streptomyces]|uniref:Winged helix-turn-helix domain-containing protein n=1 Tax=Streptomyces lichenis TaxID=2306967 RepID=A0ABT0IFH2_9ACTN|nr:winged helix-turn-helix domain-containing protein [Streptomyces lichenis]MCK8680025.1 winged helix-turn-helix domain-containing protein [Streptomyces lichenis]